MNVLIGDIGNTITKLCLAEIKNLKIKEYKSGQKVFDWKVPDEWNVKEAFVKYKNKKIIDFKKNNLHLVGYSAPVKKLIPSILVSVSAHNS